MPDARRCAVCGRRLTGQTSLRLGIGPVCARNTRQAGPVRLPVPQQPLLPTHINGRPIDDVPAGHLL
ncbi:DUF6011 domain-containing protein [Streptomyces sp. OUCMDZ-4982]|uniref:DUF6011 domain-containing protein n=1 Tax=Streptomyces sp. OUCMDZ-4982 TaxID=2973090 RepID=UPI00215D2857|nr:DUF6011 domain-containing protein [Streptomyces sp. OUCMDZ-4982]MCR8947206.1 DUF6011 domain-containing protein [Streptomyces sp. OUCMDZ-4982]